MYLVSRQVCVCYHDASCLPRSMRVLVSNVIQSWKMLLLFCTLLFFTLLFGSVKTRYAVSSAIWQIHDLHAPHTYSCKEQIGFCSSSRSSFRSKLVCSSYPQVLFQRANWNLFFLTVLLETRIGFFFLFNRALSKSRLVSCLLHDSTSKASSYVLHIHKYSFKEQICFFSSSQRCFKCKFVWFSYWWELFQKVFFKVCVFATAPSESKSICISCSRVLFQNVFSSRHSSRLLLQQEDLSVSLWTTAPSNSSVSRPPSHDFLLSPPVSRKSGLQMLSKLDKPLL